MPSAQGHEASGIAAALPGYAGAGASAQPKGAGGPEAARGLWAGGVEWSPHPRNRLLISAAKMARKNT